MLDIFGGVHEQLRIINHQQRIPTQVWDRRRQQQWCCSSTSWRLSRHLHQSRTWQCSWCSRALPLLSRRLRRLHQQSGPIAEWGGIVLERTIHSRDWGEQKEADWRSFPDRRTRPSLWSGRLHPEQDIFHSFPNQRLKCPTENSTVPSRMWYLILGLLMIENILDLDREFLTWKGHRTRNWQRMYRPT